MLGLHLVLLSLCQSYKETNDLFAFERHKEATTVVCRPMTITFCVIIQTVDMVGPTIQCMISIQTTVNHVGSLV